ncbi:MAG: aminotransferase class I/II-fold pyridoxal phosphate-dependent enzyme [Phycisphaerae bacterium]|jgi:cystathionine beta-lyase/cystathionine gamma-synthase
MNRTDRIEPRGALAPHDNVACSAWPVNADTLCARAGQGQHDGDPLVTPIVQSTTFCCAGLDSRAPHAYSRVSNPTVDALERALGAIEQAPPAVAFASGLAAEAALFFALLRSGDHVICGQAVYGGTTRLLQQVLSGLGVETTFVDSTRAPDVAAALRPNTRLVFIETPANPTLDLTDIQTVARVAHHGQALLAVDNTFLTGVLQRPLDCGADLSVYSTTKFIDGHSAALGGAIVARDERLLERLRFIRKCTGGIQTPLNAWLTAQGLKTLPLRLRRQSENAQCVAEWLAARPEVTRVLYPMLRPHAEAAIARRQHLGHHGAVVSFELAGGRETAQRLLGHVRLFRFVEHVGSVESLITHPATMTHADVPPRQRARVGVTDGLVRLSIGLEDPADLIADLSCAIQAATVETSNATPCERREAEPCPTRA